MSTKIINISLPAELLKSIDLQAKLNYSSRSEYINDALVFRLKADGAFSMQIATEEMPQIKMALAPKNPQEAQDAHLKAFLDECELTAGGVAATQQHASEPAAD